MKRVSAASALGLGALFALTLSASANAAQTHSIHDTARTGLHLAPSSGITADIHFEINYAKDAPDPALPVDFTGVAVNDEIEAPSGQMFYNEDEPTPCVSPDIDIAADLSSVTITGQDTFCAAQVAALKITIHGGEFGTMTLGEDGLFTYPDEGDGGQGDGDQGDGGDGGDVQLSVTGGAGKGAFGQSVHFALVAWPTIQTSHADSTTLSASWEGSDVGLMTGVTTFNFAAAADGADPVPADPNFTG